MANILISGLRKRFESVDVLRGIDLSIPQGQVLALLGPSGCGKTTLLRLIAGFDPVDHGDIIFDDRVMASPTHYVPPERRGIGYVPQEGSLFPHLTVEGNVRYGLPRQAQRRQRVDEVLALTDLSGYGKRYPHELSGGQQQRVALARALAPKPTLVLLDEPFNALDLDLRRNMCEDVVHMLRETGTTAILVTHDPGEAFAVSDQLAVMQTGQIMQCAQPEVVYWQPANAEVAKLTGATIFLSGRYTEKGAECDLGCLPVHQPHVLPGCPVQIMIRPEQVRWSSTAPGITARVVHRSFRGDHTVVRLALPRMQLDLRMSSLDAPAQGQSGYIQVQGPCVVYADAPCCP